MSELLIWKFFTQFGRKPTENEVDQETNLAKCNLCDSLVETKYGHSVNEESSYNCDEKIREHLNIHRQEIDGILFGENTQRSKSSREDKLGQLPQQEQNNSVTNSVRTHLESEVSEIRHQIEDLKNIVMTFFECWKSTETDLWGAKRRKKLINQIETTKVLPNVSHYSQDKDMELEPTVTDETNNVSNISNQVPALLSALTNPGPSATASVMETGALNFDITAQHSSIAQHRGAGRKKTSPVWLFMEDLGVQGVKCKVTLPDGSRCPYSKIDRCTSNLEYHLKRSHSEDGTGLWEKYEQLMKVKTQHKYGGTPSKQPKIDIQSPQSWQESLPSTSGHFVITPGQSVIKEEYETDDNDLNNFTSSNNTCSYDTPTSEERNLNEALDGFADEPEQMNKCGDIGEYNPEPVCDKEEIKKSLQEQNGIYHLRFELGRKSAAWQSFGHIHKGERKLPYIACIHCCTVFYYSTTKNFGTSTMNRHLKSCQPQA